MRYYREKKDIILAVEMGLYFIGVVTAFIINLYIYLHDGPKPDLMFKRTSSICMGLITIIIIYACERLLRVRIPFFLELLLPVYIYLALVLGIGLRFYDLVPYYDKIMHTVAGMIFTIVGYVLADMILGKRVKGPSRWLAFTVIGLTFSLAVSYCWELYEFLNDTMYEFNNAQRYMDGLVEILPDGNYLHDSLRGSGLVDTMGDLLVNLIGALLVVIVMTPIMLTKPQTYNLLAVRSFKPTKKETKEVSETPAV